MTVSIKEHPYPYNLVYQVFGREIPREELAPDLDESLEYVFETLMNGYEAFILILRFLRHMKIREIAEYYGLTEGRIRQIIQGAEFKLRHPSRCRYLQQGCAAIWQQERQLGQPDGGSGQEMPLKQLAGRPAI